MRSRCCFRVVLAVLCLALPVAAQENPEGLAPLVPPVTEFAPEEFGAGMTVHNIVPTALLPRVALWADCQLFFAAYWQPTPTTATCFLGGNYELPAGVLLLSAQVIYNDTNAAANPSLVLTRYSPVGVPTVMGTMTFPAGTPGDTSVTFNFPAGTTIDNLINVYGLEVSLPPTTRLYRVRLIYQRQVSPAPAVATFNDVPTTHAFFRFVEAMASSGITGGCGGGNFCPNTPVTRGEMAVFLSVALGLHFPF